MGMKPLITTAKTLTNAMLAEVAARMHRAVWTQTEDMIVEDVWKDYTQPIMGKRVMVNVKNWFTCNITEKTTSQNGDRSFCLICVNLNQNGGYSLKKMVRI